MLLALYYLLALLLIAASCLPVSTSRYWWVRIFDFPRLQISVALALLLALYWPLDYLGGSPSLLLVAAMLAALLWQCWWIVPYTGMYGQEISSASQRERQQCPKLRLLTSNVLMSNRDADRLLQQIQRYRPDVVSTLESDQWWQDYLDRALEDYPHRVCCPLDNRYGMHVYSRLPLTDPRVAYLVEDDIPSMHMQLQLDCGTEVDFHVVHPTPPAPGENTRSTERDVELVMLARQIETQRGPTIVTGDLNDVAWSRTTRLFRSISGLLDPRIGRGTYNTFSADYWFLRWPLDHFFASSHFRVGGITRLQPIGSDHFPIMIDLLLCGTGAGGEPIDDDSTDRQLAREIMQSEVAEQAESQNVPRGDTSEQRHA